MASKGMKAAMDRVAAKPQQKRDDVADALEYSKQLDKERGATTKPITAEARARGEAKRAARRTKVPAKEKLQTFKGRKGFMKEMGY